MWVAVVVLIQAVISYIPHYLWHSWEGGRMKQKLSNIIEKPDFIDENNDRFKRITVIGNQLTIKHKNILQGM